MEKLTNIREKMRYGKKMNRGLHGMPFKKIQFYTAYKSAEHGLKPELFGAENKSRKCPICSELSKLNGYVYECRRCGFSADRGLVADGK